LGGGSRVLRELGGSGCVTVDCCTVVYNFTRYLTRARCHEIVSRNYTFAGSKLARQLGIGRLLLPRPRFVRP
jgi:hypothetical protein